MSPQQIIQSGYAFVIPTENEGELIREWEFTDVLMLGEERIPAKEDIRYYEKFYRDGSILQKDHFIIERVSSICVDTVRTKVSCYKDDYSEELNANIAVSYKAQEYKMKDAPLWELPQEI